MDLRTVTLVEAEEDEEGSDDDEDDCCSSSVPTFNVPYLLYIDDEDEDDWSSLPYIDEEGEDEEEREERERRDSSSEEYYSCSSSCASDRCVGMCVSCVCVCVSPCLCVTFLCVCLFRYVVVSGTPLKILEHLLSDLRLDDQRGELEALDLLHYKLLLDDFLLTYLVFMTTNDLCQALLGQYPSHTDGKEALYRKRKVLHLVAHWTRLYKDFLREDEHIKAFMKVGGDTHRFGNQLLCRVYVSADSYLCVYTHSLLSVAELLRIVGQKMDRPEEDMVLVTHTPTGDSELSRRTVRLLGINTWDMAAVLTQLDWNLFNSIHEQELVYSTMSCSTGGSHREGLSVLLQRCNEVQQWVMSEVLMCVSLNKRVQLLKKFIKIAAHCKAQRNLNSAFAIIMGLNTAAVSRLNITWEKVPGKFKKIFSELELITDPSLNHKAYRDAFKKMKPPKIPFMPLLLKDITFIHEGNKTFQDNLVNFQKLHMIADTVRLIRHCQSDQLGMLSLASVHYLHIIDNQQTLFQLSHKLEPRA
uniref:Rap guanine nucleotide exchange factor (GEF) 5a n=1 Tax=Salmo trutta TaxID=8032 RepID=A0A674D8A1_SALTR